MLPPEPGVRIPSPGACVSCSPHFLPSNSPTGSLLGKAILHFWSPHFLRNQADGVIFHLLDVCLPHLSPTFKIYIYKTGNPTRAGLTGPGWILSRLESGAPDLPGLCHTVQKHTWLGGRTGTLIKGTCLEEQRGLEDSTSPKA